jgi:hypothetical protein
MGNVITQTYLQPLLQRNQKVRKDSIPLPILTTYKAAYHLRTLVFAGLAA